MQPVLFIIEAQTQPTRKSRTQKFYEDIKREYFKLCAVKKHNVRLYSDEYIFAAVGEKFYRSPKTIENIVFNRVK